MHPLISKILHKRGIKEITELNEEEKATFDKWQKILTTEEITMETLTEFITEQKARIDSKLSDIEYPKEKKLDLLPYLSIYKALLGLIKAPRSAKEIVIKDIKQLLEQ